MKIKRVIAIEKRDIQEIIDYRNGENRGQLRYEIVSNAFEAIAQSKPVDERTKGDWARHDEWVNGIYVGGFYHVNCPVIEEGYALYSRWTTHFCPNCGAPMLKGGAE